MAKVILNVPEINYQFKSGAENYSAPYTKQANIRTLTNIKTSYSGYINKYGLLFNIPSGFIAAFIATESTGRNAPPNKYKATGLMQCSPAAFYDSFKNRLKSGFIDQQQLNFIATVLPNFKISGNKVVTSLSTIEPYVLLALEKNSEFNIYAGCLYLNFLINRFAINGVAQINKTLIGYNAGAYNKVISSTITVAADSTSLAANKLVPKESRGYLVKMLGINGFLDLIYGQRLISF